LSNSYKYHQIENRDYYILNYLHNFTILQQQMMCKSFKDVKSAFASNPIW